MKKNKRGRPKQQQQKNNKNDGKNQSESAEEDSPQQDRRSTTPQYDKIMLQIKETYANLTEANEAKVVKVAKEVNTSKRKIHEPKILKPKPEPVNKKRGRPSKKKEKCSKKMDELVKLESQEPAEILEKTKSQLNSVMKKFLDNVTIEYKKTEQELTKILLHK